MMHEHVRSRVIIMGAAGRDFHNFNAVFRGDPVSRVVAFTAAQISPGGFILPHLADRCTP